MKAFLWVLYFYLLGGGALLGSTYLGLWSHGILRESLRRSPWLRWYRLVFLWPVSIYQEWRDPE